MSAVTGCEGTSSPGPFGRRRCIEIAAQRGKDPHRKAWKLQLVAKAKAAKRHGAGNDVWLDVRGSQINPSQAMNELVAGRAVTLSWRVPIREGESLFDPGEWQAFDFVVTP